jgi:hypothetical protein
VAWCIGIGLAGCASDELGPVRSFSTSASSFVTEANAALVTIDDSYIQRNIAKVASGDSELTDDVFKGVLAGDPGVAAAKAALTALGRYADSINALASADYASQIDTAATNLYGSLTDIEKNAGNLAPAAPKISDSDLGLLATAIKAIGTAVAQRRQAEAIRTAIVIADPVVQTIASGMAKIFGDLRSSSTYTKNLDIIYTAEFTAYKREVASPRIPYSEKVSRLDELDAAYVANQDADAFLSKLSASATALGVAHAKIKQSLTGPSSKSADMIRTIGQLQSFVNDLKTFDTSLKKGAAK